MNDTEYRTQEKRVSAILKRWSYPLGLNWWHLSIKIEREIDAEAQDDSDGYHTVMHTVVRWEYRTATITIYGPHIIDMEDDKLEHCLLHEFMHVWTAEACEKPHKHVERVVDSLAWMLKWTREAGYKDAAKDVRRKAAEKALLEKVKVADAG